MTHHLRHMARNTQSDTHDSASGMSTIYFMQHDMHKKALVPSALYFTQHDMRKKAFARSTIYLYATRNAKEGVCIETPFQS